MKKLPSVSNIDIKLLSYHPVDKSKWKDFEKLFGERGACGGCWCMAWRLKNSDFQMQKGAANKNAIKKTIYSNEHPGILAYYDKQAIGWCAVAPREKYIRLEKSKVLRRIDNKPTWSISCFFIAKEFRRKGISSELLKAAVEFCKSQGAKIVEVYPIVPYSENIPASFAWTGIPSACEKAGFKEVARRSKSRPIMRYYI
ncbi:MAG TPA: GNAT family N-acetyltransferase [Ignavibacteriaceae bacterium]|nr:GNAT family N-acetyltransferase [Ignavibacteriaceae bacterium]